jgi:hypothetical protein
MENACERSRLLLFWYQIANQRRAPARHDDTQDGKARVTGDICRATWSRSTMEVRPIAPSPFPKVHLGRLL